MCVEWLFRCVLCQEATTLPRMLLRRMCIHIYMLGFFFFILLFPSILPNRPDIFYLHFPFPKHTKAVAVVQLLAFSDSRHDNFIHVLSHSVHQIVAFRGDMAESSATYLFEGLFPSLSRYLSEKSRYVSNLGILNFCRQMLIFCQGHEAGCPTHFRRGLHQAPERGRYR